MPIREYIKPTKQGCTCGYQECKCLAYEDLFENHFTYFEVDEDSETNTCCVLL